MTRVCTVCRHPDRAAIDEALVAGAAYRDIAGQFQLSPSSVHRHSSEHIPATLSQAAEAVEVARADDLLSQVRSLQARALAILAKAEEAGDLRTALGAIREARGNLELLARLLGELDDTPTVNVLVSPQWLGVRAAILGALEPHPAARVAVAAALEDAGARG